MLTTSRGSNGNLPIAEYALASILMWAKGLPQGLRDAAAGQFSGREVYGSQLLQSKTVGIVGLGGIGAELAKLASGIGLRVIATRRTIDPDAPLPEGVSELLPAAELPALLAQVSLSFHSPRCPRLFSIFPFSPRLRAVLPGFLASRR